MDRDEATAWGATTPTLRNALRASLANESPAALATVVAVDGSAYRRPGAKMLAPADADSMGAITAGCLEGPIGEVASTVRETGNPEVATYDLTDDEGWGMGLGCNGVVTVLVEPVDASFGPALDALAERTPVAMVTGLDEPHVGARQIVTPDGSHRVPDRPGLPDEIIAEIRQRAREFREVGNAGVLTVREGEHSIRVFVDGLRPAPELLVVGSQPDVNPVARLGRAVGFRVTVATTRGSVPAERFPAAETIEYVRAPDVDEVVTAPPDTYAVVMTHNFVDDRLAVEALLETDVPYVGLMGPRERFEDMQEAWAEADVQLPPDSLERIATPVGLDLGGGQPAEIALAIVSEAVAVRNGRDGGRLRDHEGPIHPRLDGAEKRTEGKRNDRG